MARNTVIYNLDAAVTDVYLLIPVQMLSFNLR